MKNCLLLALSCCALSANAFTYSTGFETAEGWTVGSAAQNGFTAFPQAPAGPKIQTDNPKDGNQHLRLNQDPSVGSPEFNGILGPDWTANLQNMDVITTSIDVFITNAGGANYDIGAQDNTGKVFFDVSFDWQTSILIYGPNETFVDTNIVWSTNQWFNFKIISDMNAQTHTYYYKGVNIYSHAFYDATEFGQIALFSDNAHLANEFGDMDNLNVTAVPEPATLTLLTLASLAIAKKRKSPKS